MKRLKQRISRAFGADQQHQDCVGADDLGWKRTAPHTNGVHHEWRQRHEDAPPAFCTAQFFPGDPAALKPGGFERDAGRLYDSVRNGKYRWSLCDSQLAERIADMSTVEEEPQSVVAVDEAMRHVPPKNGCCTVASAAKAEKPHQNGDPFEHVPMVLMRNKRQKQQRQYSSNKTKSWHASRWFGNVVHAASASFSHKMGNAGATGSDAESGGGGEMSPSTSGGDQSAASSSTAEYRPHVKMRDKKHTAARRLMSEEEIQKRLSLPAYINIPPAVMDKLSRTPTLENPLTRKSRRTSLSEIGFGKLETYKKILDLGEGTYATVFLGLSLLTGKSVALKEIRLEHEEGAPCTAIREISLLRNLKHSNIVTLHDVVHTDNLLTLVFEYVEQDLREYMEELEEWMCIANVKLFLVQLLRGLAYCHAKRILHRDLKPQNLLITKRGELKLADFGLARAQSIPTKTYSSEVVTLWYRPPDVLLGCTEYTSHIDMWGVGCILYEMLAHKPIFPGARVDEQLELIFRRLGTPTSDAHPQLCALAGFQRCAHKLGPHPARTLLYLPNRITQERAELLHALLAYEGKQRVSAPDALRHPFLNASIPATAVLALPDTESVLSLPGVQFVQERKREDLAEMRNWKTQRKSVLG